MTKPQISEFEADTLRVLAEADRAELAGLSNGNLIRFSFADFIADISLSILEGTDHGTTAVAA